MLAAGDLLKLNAERFPGCHLHRSNPSDVARVEHLTFVCTENRDDAGQNNHWMDARRGAAQDGRAVRRLHARAHDVRHPVLHGADRFALLALRRRDHRQRLRRRQHEADDAHGRCRAQAHRARREVREGPALHRPARSRAPVHHALPGVARDPELRVGLRRQRAARQEVPCAADRELAGARRRLARRAHADRRRREPAGRGPLSRLRFPVGLRQDEPRHADPAGVDARLEDLDRRRRHRLAAPGPGRPAVGDQSRGGLLRRRARHQRDRRTATPTR